MRAEKQWDTPAGLLAVVSVVDNSYKMKNYDSHRCGYVRVLPGHPAYLKNHHDPLFASISVHGGLSFSGDFILNNLPEKVWWLGFDCLHAGDGIIEPQPEFSFFNAGIPRSLSFVEAECNSLALQLQALK